MNLHTHGLETSPLDDGDNIFRSMNPGTTSESRIKILGTNGDGIDWYHTHKHGYVSDQVYGGLAGIRRSATRSIRGRSTEASTRSGCSV